MAINTAETIFTSVPGTEFLLSHEGNEDHVRLIPEPSDNLDDPLNWSNAWKTTVIINQAIFVFVTVFTPLSIAPLTPIFTREFNADITQVNMLFGVVAITLGYANFIIVPAANIFGRRPVILVCGIICTLANVWQALVTSYGSFLGARVVSGLGAGVVESIMPMVIADTMFIHRRGAWVGLYFWSFSIGIFCGPIIAGSIASSISWRWFFWICTILQALTTLSLVFTMPETMYLRKHAAVPGRIDPDLDERKFESPIADSNSPSDTATEDMISYRKSSNDGSPIHPRTQHIKGYPSRKQFALFVKPTFIHGSLKETILRDVLAPIQIFFYPITLWAGMSFGFASNCFLGLNLTQSQVFAAPPYLFSTAQVGFVNFAFVGGGVVGLLTAGPASDWISIRLARRNGGVREAEMRLWALIPYIAILLIGMVVTAIGYDRLWSWPVIVIVGYGFVGVEVVSISAIVIAYAVDCYKHIPGQIMVTATVCKNTFGFGMIFFFNDWTVRSGFIPPLMMLTGLGVGITALGTGLFLWKGKWFRERTAGSKLHDL